MEVISQGEGVHSRNGYNFSPRDEFFFAEMQSIGPYMKICGG